MAVRSVSLPACPYSQCCQMFFSEPAPPTLKPAQFASPTNSKNLNSKTSPIFHQNSLKFRTFFGKSRKNVHPAQPAPSPAKILPAPQTLKTARGAGNSPIWQHCLQYGATRPYPRLIYMALPLFIYILANYPIEAKDLLFRMLIGQKFFLENQ